jgi:hypothetical protein
MSEYDYDDRPRRRSHRTRDREPEYVSETTYIQRGTGQPSRDLVFRGREDSIEEIDRDFPPPTSEYRRTKVRDEYPPARSSRSSRNAPRSDYYDDDYYSDYGPPAAAAAGYVAGRRARPKPRRGRDDDDYYSEDNERPRRERRKSRIEEAIEGLGLGGAVAALTGKSEKDRRSKSRSGKSRRGSSRGSDDGYRSSSSRERRKKWQQAAKAAVLTGVVEAVRSRNEPGGWTGPKGKRVATAALGAAAADGFLDRDPNNHSKRHIIESVVGGLAANRIANGSRNRSDSRGRSVSRSRSRGAGIRDRSRSLFRSLSRGGGRDRSESAGGGRSRSRGRGLKEVAALGGIAAIGKGIYDRVRSKSRGRGKRSPSASSEDSYVPTRRQRYQGDRDTRDDQDDRGRGPPQGDEYDRDAQRGRSERAADGEGSGKRESSSDSVSTTDLENQRKKTRGKELLTAGLATVATIHAAHGVYSSMVASEKRHKLVMEGEMSPEEARKRKSKNMLQDAAAVGIAALGLKSAFSEWKEMNEHRHGVQELEDKRRKRRKMREKRDRESRNHGGQNAIAYPYPVPAGYGPPAYADGNPYAAVGNLPPPPMGNAPQRY